MSVFINQFFIVKGAKKKTGKKARQVARPAKVSNLRVRLTVDTSETMKALENCAAVIETFTAGGIKTDEARVMCGVTRDETRAAELTNADMRRICAFCRKVYMRGIVRWGEGLLADICSRECRVAYAENAEARRNAQAAWVQNNSPETFTAGVETKDEVQAAGSVAAEGDAETFAPGTEFESKDGYRFRLICSDIWAVSGSDGYSYGNIPRAEMSDGFAILLNKAIAETRTKSESAAQSATDAPTQPAAEWFTVSIGGREVKRGQVHTEYGPVIVTLGQNGRDLGENEDNPCACYSFFYKGDIYEVETYPDREHVEEKFARVFAETCANGTYKTEWPSAVKL